MAKPRSSSAALKHAHGTAELPSVTVSSYNLELKDDEGFIGDKASKGAFFDILEDLRQILRMNEEDPLDKSTDALNKKKLDELFQSEDVKAASLLHSAVEKFSQQLATVTKKFLRTKSWSEVERIVVGGGFQDSRIGRLSIGRADILLHESGLSADLTSIKRDPDDAGLVGSVHLAPKWIFEAYDSIVAVDIGGTNIRAGIVQLNHDVAPDLAKAKVWKSEIWRHADRGPTRDEAVKKLGKMIAGLIEEGERKKRRIAPFIGVGCPGIVLESGVIERGGQNLPGDWEDEGFNLPDRLAQLIPTIGDHETLIAMHNDAVVQGLSELPSMSDVTRWAVLTIGTGLGNASFVNKEKPAKAVSKGRAP